MHNNTCFFKIYWNIEFYYFIREKKTHYISLLIMKKMNSEDSGKRLKLNP